MEKTEIDVEGISAHGKNTIGCIKHKKNIMISYTSKNKEKDGNEIINLFLTLDQAKSFLSSLERRIYEQE